MTCSNPSCSRPEPPRLPGESARAHTATSGAFRSAASSKENAAAAREHDFRQYLQVREDAQRLGMPLIVWAYPRGTAIDAKGGKDSFYAVDYAARTASELGADVVKVNFPHPEQQSSVPEGYRGEFSSQQAIDALVRSANRSLLLVSGGGRADTQRAQGKAPSRPPLPSADRPGDVQFSVIGGAALAVL